MQCRRCKFSPWVGKVPWRTKWQPTPVLLSGGPHGQRSLEGYSPGGPERVRLDSGTKQQQRARSVCMSTSTFQLTPFASWRPYICSLGLNSLFKIGKSSSNSPHRFPLTSQSQDLCQEQYLRDCLGPIPILPCCWAHFSQPKSRFNQHERKESDLSGKHQCPPLRSNKQ